jgi:hypothetical protein
MITPNGIQYTWNQIFDRLGIQADKNLTRISNKKVQFHYAKQDEVSLDPQCLHLIISPGNPDNLDRICDDTDFRVCSLSKLAFLPSPESEFPVDELPILFCGADAPKNVFGEIIEGRVLIIYPDLIQNIFFQLSRYEEYHLKNTDKHGRFPYRASSANRFNSIELPLVDLYIHILKLWLEELTGEKLIPKGKFEITLSHDVDYLSPYQPMTNWLRTFAKDAIRLKWMHLPSDIRYLFSDFAEDPYYSGVKKLADISTRHNLTSTFYLMAANPSGLDEGYSLNSTQFTQTLQTIRDHRHKIGLHASYRSFDHPELILEEKLRLEDAVKTEITTIRQHYLRVQTPQSWEAWAGAGFTKDTSYGFSEHEGFRCGTCHAYPVFDLRADRELELIEEPLIVMDATLKAYRKISVDNGIEKINQLAKICKFVEGNFTLLWHNTSFFRGWQIWGEKYPQIVAGLVEASKS